MTDPIPTIPARDIVRHYKKVFEQVTTTNTPVIVTARDGKKVAVISVADLETLRLAKSTESAKTLLSTALQARKLTKEEALPSDLSVRHDAYLWEQ